MVLLDTKVTISTSLIKCSLENLSCGDLEYVQTNSVSLQTVCHTCLHGKDRPNGCNAGLLFWGPRIHKFPSRFFLSIPNFYHSTMSVKKILEHQSKAIFISSCMTTDQQMIQLFPLIPWVHNDKDWIVLEGGLCKIHLWGSWKASPQVRWQWLEQGYSFVERFHTGCLIVGLIVNQQHINLDLNAG